MEQPGSRIGSNPSISPEVPTTKDIRIKLQFAYRTECRTLIRLIGPQTRTPTHELTHVPREKRVAKGKDGYLFEGLYSDSNTNSRWYMQCNHLCLSLSRSLENVLVCKAIA